MPTPPEIYLSSEWAERPVNVGELYFIQTSVKQVMASERSESRREWVKEIAGCVVLAALGLVAAVIWMVM